MRILVVTNLYPGSTTSLDGIYVRDQVLALRRRGHHIDVLFIDGVRNRWNYLWGLFRLWGRLCRGRFDLIHAHYVYSGIIARAQVGVPVVVTSHGSDTLGAEGRLLRMLRPLVSAVTITSRQNQERSGLRDTDLLPCGADVELFRPHEREAARRRLGWDLDRHYLLYVGRDVPTKRLDIARGALDLVKVRYPNADLILATDIAHDLVPLYMSAADVFVFPSETEGAPVVIKEALACNLPIVSTDVGDVREMTQGISQCRIVERTPEAIAQGVIEILAAGCRSDGRRRAEEFSHDAMALRIESVYRRVLMA